MSYLFAMIVGFIFGYIIKSSKNKKTPDQILKETPRFRYLFRNNEVIVHVSDRYEYENKIVSKPKKTTPATKRKKTGVSFEEAAILNERKIESKYLYPKKDIEDQSNFFFNKKVVISGTFFDFPDRNDLAKLFWDAGADIDVGVGKNTKYLIVGDDYGPKKMETALEQNITVIDQDNLSLYFKNYN